MSALDTPFCAAFGVRWPIVQTGMGWVSGARLTAATAEAGGLGFLASATMTVAELERAIAEVQARTTRPFGVNLRADHHDAAGIVALIQARGVSAASFAGAPSEKLIKSLRDAGVRTMPTIGARRHAEKMQKWGVTAVIAQGHEGGGHTGPVPTTLLLPDVCRAVDIPVLGAGGFHCGRGLVAALAYGAQGVAMGTRFLLTRESRVPDEVKSTYLSTDVKGTVVSLAVDGHPQRVVRTPLVDALEQAGPLGALVRAIRHGLAFKQQTGLGFAALLQEARSLKASQGLTWGQVFMAANAPMLTKASLVDGRLDTGILPTGQVVGMIDELPTVAELIDRIVAEAEETLARLASPAPARLAGGATP